MTARQPSRKNLIVLVHPGVVTGEYPYMPFESLFMGRFLMDHGYDVMLLDQRVEADWERLFAEVADQVLWAGLTVITGPQVGHALRTARRIREIRSTIPVVWGGWHPTFIPTMTVEHPLVDFVVAGIGELKVLELSEHIAGGCKGKTRHPGILSKRGRTDYVPVKETFEDLPGLPAYQLIDVENYRSENNLAGVVTSRGCPFRCGFCTIAQIAFLGRSVETVVDELDFLVNRHGFEEIRFADGLFFAQRARVLKILDKLDERGVKFRWHASTPSHAGRTTNCGGSSNPASASSTPAWNPVPRSCCHGSGRISNWTTSFTPPGNRGNSASPRPCRS